MSEMDKYTSAAHEIWALSGIGPSEGIENAAERITAYLRERFVTREEYSKSLRALYDLQNGYHERAKELATLTAERDRLRRALVEAAIPLEAMLISGATQGLWQGLQQGIAHGAECCRQALNPEDV